MTSGFWLRHLCIVGPGKDDALVEFKAGLNVIYGASDTGKSYLVEAIDFMLGGSRKLRDIPESVGYDRIFLGIEAANGDLFTLARPTAGGSFRLYDGLHQSAPATTEGTLLQPKHNNKNSMNISRFLLGIVDLDGKMVRKNKRGDTRSLSFRDLAHLCLVDEGSIQKKESPVIAGQVINVTVETSVFKFLLSGVDDSALEYPTPARRVASQAGALELLDELIANYESQLAKGFRDPADLEEQIGRLEASIAHEQQLLQESEGHYVELFGQQRNLREKLDKCLERAGEIRELIARFDLLNKHYQSDLARLQSICETGSLLVALPSKSCSACGALPEHQQDAGVGTKQIELAVLSAQAEAKKIERLSYELGQTVASLHLEAAGFEELTSSLSKRLEQAEGGTSALRQSLVERRATYANLVDGRAALLGSQSIHVQLAGLRDRRAAVEQTSEEDGTAIEETNVALPSSLLHSFSREVQDLLKAWHFPETSDVYFDEGDRDFVIDGKRRSSQGKGKRSITHAAFNIGLMTLCIGAGRQHPGFVILDSPLLAYRQPEGKDDDLRGTDVKDRFYEYLAGLTEQQVIVVENVTPPDSVVRSETTTIFSKNVNQSPYGLFPVPKS